MTTPRNPMQPLIRGVRPGGEATDIFFKPNAVVQHLRARINLNKLTRQVRASQDDWEQFWQLIGYSLKGFHELSMVSDETALAASAEARKQWPDAQEGCRDVRCELHCGIEREPT